MTHFTLKSRVHTERVDASNQKIVSVHTERVAWRRNQICLIFGSVDARQRHSTRRVRCEGGFTVRALAYFHQAGLCFCIRLSVSRLLKDVDLFSWFFGKKGLETRNNLFDFFGMIWIRNREFAVTPFNAAEVPSYWKSHYYSYGTCLAVGSDIREFLTARRLVNVAGSSRCHRAFLLAGACVCCVKFSRNKRKCQPIGMFGRSSGRNRRSTTDLHH